MTDMNRGSHPSLWSQPPLPGMTRCLTLQLNATYYKEQASCRWTVILRDPDANVEVGRLIAMTRADDQDASDELIQDLGQMLTLVDYMFHGTVDDLKSELASDPPPPGGATPPRKPRTRSVKA